MDAFILAGGKSRRMGADKAYLNINGDYFLDHIINLLSKLFLRISIVGRKYKHPKIHTSVTDIIKNIGPIGGIYTALKISKTEKLFIIGLDYPLINMKIIKIIIDISKSHYNKNYQAFVPEYMGKIHPLIAVYSKSAIEHIINQINNNDYKITNLINKIRTFYIDFADKKYGILNDKLTNVFHNINNPEDYKIIIENLNRAKTNKKGEIL